MKYISSEEMAKKWGVSSRRVILLAKEGRIPNVMQIGMRWMIPEDAEKPIDGRTKVAKIKQENNSFRLPLFLDCEEDDYYPTLSAEEKLLRKAQLDFNACNLEAAKEPLLFLSSSNNIYIRIAAVMHLSILMLALKEFDKFSEYKRKLLILLSQDFPYHNEMMLFKYLFDVIMGITKALLEDFSIDSNYSYHPSSFGLLSALSIFTAADDDVSSISRLHLDPFEAICQQLEHSGKYFDAQLLHIQLIYGYQMQGKIEQAMQHMRNALNIARDRNLVYLTAINITYVPEIFNAVSCEYPADFIEKITYYAKFSNEAYILLTEALGKVTIYTSLSGKDFRFVYLASQGYTNKRIAELMGTSEFYVSKRFSEIYRKLKIKGKTELKKLFTETVI